MKVGLFREGMTNSFDDACKMQDEYVRPMQENNLSLKWDESSGPCILSLVKMQIDCSFGRL